MGHGTLSNNAFVSTESDPYVRLLAAIFAGPYGKSPMHVQQRLEWLAQNLPYSYSTIALDNNWAPLTAMQENLSGTVVR